MTNNTFDSDKVRSATLFGTAILSNLRYDSDNPRFQKQIIFDAQFIMKNSEDMVTALRYWNENGLTFAEKPDGSLGRYIILATITAIDSTANIRMNDKEMEHYHLVGDILWFEMLELPSTSNNDEVFDPPFMSASGRVLSFDTNNSSFELESYPWVGVYRSYHRLGTCARFDTTLPRFKNRLPMPNVGRIVSVCGPIGAVHETPSTKTTTSSTTSTTAAASVGDTTYMIGLDIHEIGFLSPLNVAGSNVAAPSTPRRGQGRFQMRVRGSPAASTSRREMREVSPSLLTPTIVLPVQTEEDATEFRPAPPSSLQSLGLNTPATATMPIAETATTRRNVRKRRRDNLNEEEGGGNDGSGSLSSESTLTRSSG